jgi:hypothetical protein
MIISKEKIMKTKKHMLFAIMAVSAMCVLAACTDSSVSASGNAQGADVVAVAPESQPDEDKTANDADGENVTSAAAGTVFTPITAESERERLIAFSQANDISMPATTDVVEGDYIPLWMQPDTVIVYFDDVGACTIIEGGELSEEELASREDIASIGLINVEAGFHAEPYTRVTYDLHGFHNNTYFLVPDDNGIYDVDRYQLSPPDERGN